MAISFSSRSNHFETFLDWFAKVAHVFKIFLKERCEEGLPNYNLKQRQLMLPNIGVIAVLMVLSFRATLYNLCVLLPKINTCFSVWLGIDYMKFLYDFRTMEIPQTSSMLFRHTARQLQPSKPWSQLSIRYKTEVVCFWII